MAFAFTGVLPWIASATTLALASLLTGAGMFFSRGTDTLPCARIVAALAFALADIQPFADIGSL